MPPAFWDFQVKTITYLGYIYYLLPVAYTLLNFVFTTIMYASIVLVLLIFHSIHPPCR